MKNNQFVLIVVGIFLLLTVSQSVWGDELVHKFKNPSFSGIGTSAHYLTIENQEKSRRDALEDKIEAELKAQQRELENTTVAKFIKNVESRIYANLSKQLVDNMFGTSCDSTTTNCPTSGTSEVEGATIYWVKDTTTEIITLTITDENGSVTSMSVPIGDFVF